MKLNLGKVSTSNKVFYSALALVTFLIIFNQILVLDIQAILRGDNPAGKFAFAGNLSADVGNLIMISGQPEIYGSELGVEYVNPVNQQLMNQMIARMKQYDPTYGTNKITLTGESLKRYIDIGSRIACEYCCGAKTLVFKDGQAACGCAHSQSMRGLAAYLLKYHGGHYSDDQILRELARWKGLYFPKQMAAKLISQLGSGNYTPDIAALLLGVDTSKISKDVKNAPVPSTIQNLPNQSGGC